MGRIKNKIKDNNGEEASEEWTEDGERKKKKRSLEKYI